MALKHIIVTMALVWPICNGTMDPPKKLDHLYPGASLPVEVCHHDLDGDGEPDIVLIYCKGPDGYELVRAMRVKDFYMIEPIVED